MRRASAAGLTLSILLTIVPDGVRADTASEAAPATSPDSADPITLEEVLASVEAHYPLLRIAEAARDVAAGDLQSARGSFDTRLVGEADLRPLGFYENYSGNTGIEQPTQLWGAEFFAGYRIGRGATASFPSYDGGRQTKGNGEWRGGFELPLFRGRAIDEPRAELRRAELALDQVDPEITLQRIDFERQAALSYWSWVASGLGVDVSQRLVDVAAARQSQLEGRVRRGAVPRIDLTDNERLVVDRTISLRGAERDAEQAAISLSLFLRDGAGNPLIPGRDRLPSGFPTEQALGPDQLALDLERAAARHPELRALAFEVDQLDVELALARNDVLPEVDLRVEASQDYGSTTPGLGAEGPLSPDPKGSTELKAQVKLAFPIQRREARGRVVAASAKLQRIEARLRFARDRIEADIRRASAALEAAFAQAQAARRNLELARELQRAEERKLSLGNSNLIDVNIRELQAADAERALISTLADYHKARASYRAAVAVGP